ncbi:hypothetical protein K501DRAFT_269356 [Backusella circina FSU 941]|nr:hypothetical protein K501DRAFT_269356 [Backusella circina FSU 941]
MSRFSCCVFFTGLLFLLSDSSDDPYSDRVEDIETEGLEDKLLSTSLKVEEIYRSNVGSTGMVYKKANYAREGGEMYAYIFLSTQPHTAMHEKVALHEISRILSKFKLKSYVFI